MQSFLTGEMPERASDDPSGVEKDWTREDYLLAMRRNLAAARVGSPDGELRIAAAAVLVEAAKVAGRPVLPAKATPTRTSVSPAPSMGRVKFSGTDPSTPPARTAPHGDAI